MHWIYNGKEYFTWSDCFGEHRVDSLEDFIRQYADEQVAMEIAGEAW